MQMLCMLLLARGVQLLMSVAPVPAPAAEADKVLCQANGNGTSLVHHLPLTTFCVTFPCITFCWKAKQERVFQHQWHTVVSSSWCTQGE